MSVQKGWGVRKVQECRELYQQKKKKKGEGLRISVLYSVHLFRGGRGTTECSGIPLRSLYLFPLNEDAFFSHDM